MATPTTPWNRPKPKTTSKTTLKPKYKARAKAAAARAGRRYPNLVDNMAAARQQREDEETAKRGEAAPVKGRKKSDTAARRAL